MPLVVVCPRIVRIDLQSPRAAARWRAACSGWSRWARVVLLRSRWRSVFSSATLCSGVHVRVREKGKYQIGRGEGVKEEHVTSETRQRQWDVCTSDAARVQLSCRMRAHSTIHVSTVKAYSMKTPRYTKPIAGHRFSYFPSPPPFSFGLLFWGAPFPALPALPPFSDDASSLFRGAPFRPTAAAPGRVFASFLPPAVLAPSPAFFAAPPGLVPPGRAPAFPGAGLPLRAAAPGFAGRDIILEERRSDRAGEIWKNY